jgi:phage shock protein C
LSATIAVSSAPPLSLAWQNPNNIAEPVANESITVLRAPRGASRLTSFQIAEQEEGHQMPTGQLIRSRSDRMIAGVCGGLAQWLGWDSTAVRVLYVLVSIFSVAFPGILVYIILALVMPLEE